MHFIGLGSSVKHDMLSNKRINLVYITKTRLFKYTENFTTKKMKIFG